MEALGLPTADFFKIDSFGKQAENNGKYLKRGSLVAVLGKLSSNTVDGKFYISVISTEIKFLEYNKKTSPEEYNEEDFKEVEVDDDIPF